MLWLVFPTCNQKRTFSSSPPAGGCRSSARYLMVCAALLVNIASGYADTIQDQARVVLEQFSAAGKAKDADTVSQLLSDDCVIIMTEPAAGANRARFFSKESYLRLLKERYAQTSAVASKRTIQSITPSPSGQVFVTVECDEHTQVQTRTEWIRSHEYIVMQRIDDRMRICVVVAELASYVPNVSQDAPSPQRNNN